MMPPTRRFSSAARPLAALFAVIFIAPSLARASFDPSPYGVFEGKLVSGISFTGNRTTKESFIRRELGLAVGDTLSVERLGEGIRNLENYGIFGSITVAAKDSADGVHLDYQFREMPSYIPFVAVQYTEEDGFSIGPAVAAVNLFGRGIRASGSVLFGGTTSFELVARYPWITADYRLGLMLRASHLSRDDDFLEFEETSDEITPWVTRYLGEHGRVRGMIGYFHMKSDRDGVTLSSDRSDHFLRVGAAVGHDTRDSWRDTRNGWQNEIEVVGNIGDGDFATTTIDLRRFQRLTRKQTLFLGGLASLQTGEVGADVPAYLQYFIGGANSVRGQNVDLGNSLFGKNQMIATAEYQLSLLPLRPYNFFKWSAAMGLQLAVFADAGTAWSAPDDLSMNRAKGGFGTGLRLLIPGVEMIRFDVGFNRQGDVYFHFGGGFKWEAQRLRLR
ncbi:MAG: Surface antigen variable number repeat-containing protein [Candidatus Krumholzibacteriota bacterium]|nr:Surface antigen variable number repeat-containing protein [Candidatus Krumholzibacteriota bacterium]